MAQFSCMRGGSVYIMTNRANATRARKIRLIEMDNPGWDDLYDRLA